jgi:hypothetical protein
LSVSTEESIRSDSSELREIFRTGKAPVEQKLAVCAGMVVLAPADLAEILILISSDSDERIADRASTTLKSLPSTAYVAAASRPDAAPQVFEYCAKHLVAKPDVAAAIFANPACPPETLLGVVKNLTAEGVQSLAESLELLSMQPEMAAILLKSATLTLDQRMILEELGQGAPNAEALTEAVNDAEADPAKRQSLLQRLARMRVTERVQLALKGGREERMALIRDSCRVVQRAVLQSPKLSDQEVEGFAGLTSLSEEVLRVIATNRGFRKNYAITKNLVTNPKTPLDVSLHLLPHIHTPELRILASNKNIPETLRTTSAKMHRQRTAKKD